MSLSKFHSPRRGVLITRDEEENSLWVAQLRQKGLIPYFVDSLKIASLPLRQRSLKQLQQSERANLIFTSQRAVTELFSQLKKKWGPKDLQHWQHGLNALFAVGATTALTLSRCGFKPVYYPDYQRGSAELVEWILSNRALLNGQENFFPVAAGQGKFLVEQLASFEIVVQPLAIYRVDSKPIAAEKLQPLARGQIGAMLFFSPSAARALVLSLKEQNLLRQALSTPALAIGPATAKTLKELGFLTIFEAKESRVSELVARLTSSVL